VENFTNKFDVLKDIAERTGGDIYLGVVGPVRTGKSTFIKRFMELLVLPNILDLNERERANDELPQSGAGRTVMTCEPKFIPAQAVEINIAEGLDMRVRLVDCVGYTVEGALGFEEDDGPRMIYTPWSEEEMPFAEAAEIGTRKVISEHSTIGLVVLSDGSITDIPAENYLPAEERVMAELKELGKPYVIVLNCLDPQAESTQLKAAELTEKYGVQAIAVNVATMDYDSLLTVMREALYEFPITELNINMPCWVEELEESHWLRHNFQNNVQKAVQEVYRVRDVDRMLEILSAEQSAQEVVLEELALGSGTVNIKVEIAHSLFYQILGEYAGQEISGDNILLRLMRDFSSAHREWNKVSVAIEQAKGKGYGVITPRINEMYLEEPELIKQGGRFGVKLKASAPSFHVIRANISTEITPLIGTESQCEELVAYIMNEFEDDPQKIWATNIFGKSLNELVQEGIQGKVYRMPENAQIKLQETLQRIINEGGGGLICIII
jgi:stage IV sporulation protein A